MQGLQCFGRRIGIDVDLHRNVVVPGIAFPEPEKAVQVEVTLELDAEAFYLDTGDRRVGGISDREAIAVCRQDLLNGIGPTIGAAQLPGLIG